ncbi:hypothetical protein ACHWQZ_G007904 [Mnemiopsis leidyi]
MRIRRHSTVSLLATISWSIQLISLINLTSSTENATTVPQNTPWTDDIGVVTTKLLTEKKQRPVTTLEPRPETTWNQAPLEPSDGPLGAVGVASRCWNFLAGSFLDKTNCGENPGCCFTEGTGSGCCDEKWECCGSRADPYLCCEPGMKCCRNSSRLLEAVCCYESEECVYNTEEGVHACVNKHWLPFAAVGVLWAVSLLTYLMCSYLIYSNKARVEENYLALENS